MRSLLDVKTEIAEIIAKRGYFKNEREESIARKRIPFLNMVAAYLEGVPDETFIRKEILRLKNRINLLREAFDGSGYKDPREAKKQYEKQMGIPGFEKQIEALEWILTKPKIKSNDPVD